MAAAEARAVWQRAVNRFFVQEDAKRAPKLACCQSSSSSSAKQVDSGSSGAIDLPDQSASNYMPLNPNPRFQNLPSDLRWWVHTQTSHVNQKGLDNEVIDPSEAEMEIPEQAFMKSHKGDDSHLHPKGDQEGTYCEKHSFGVGEEELNMLKFKEMRESIESMKKQENCDFVGNDHFDFTISQKLKEPESPWISREKTGPWWRNTDKDELPSLVAQKSLGYIENCDLPTPQKARSRKQPYSDSPCLDCDELSSLDHKSQAFRTLTALQQRGSSADGHGRYWFEKSFRHNANHSDIREAERDSSEKGLSKSELLEALRRSQTRAREAEQAAKEAYVEKENLVKLVFKQTSQLFAYKQWFQLLQLEALYLQIKKNDDPPISTLPRNMPCEIRKAKKRLRKGKRGKGSRSKPDVTTYAVAFALGLGLVGAGLLLGWTVGWMLPF